MNSSNTGFQQEQDFIPLKLSTRRHPGRVRNILKGITMFCAFVSAFAVAGILGWAAYEESSLPSTLLQIGMTIPVLLFVSGIALLRSVKAALLLSLLSVFVAVVVTARWIAVDSAIESMLDQIRFVIFVVGPSLVVVVLTLILFRMRSHRIRFPLI